MPYKQGKKWRAVPIVDGKRVEQATFGTRREALEHERAVRLKYSRVSHGMGFASASNAYLDFSEANHRPATYKAKVKALNALASFLGHDVPVEDINKPLLKRFCAARLKESPPSMVNRNLKDLSSFFNWLGDEYEIEHNPAKRIPDLKQNKRPRPAYTHDQITKMLATSKGEDRVFLECYIYTGAREREVYRMRWADIDHPNGQICLWSRKTSTNELSPQWIPLLPALSKSLKWLYGHRGNDEYVFASPLTGDRYQDADGKLRRICRNGGVPFQGFHALRRYVGTHLANSGVPLPVVQQIMRHGSLVHTARYIRVQREDILEQMKVLQTETAKGGKVINLK